MRGLGRRLAASPEATCETGLPRIAQPRRIQDRKVASRPRGRGKPAQVKGWEGGEKGSLLEPEDYQKLAGPWVNGKDPAAG